MIVVHGKPRGKMRPRFTRNGHSYKDPKDVEYEKKQIVLDTYKKKD